MSRPKRPKLQIICGSYDSGLGAAVAQRLGIELTDPGIVVFANGERKPEIKSSVRRHHVFIFQSHMPPDVAIREQRMLINACRLASAREITAVFPFMGYMRQDHPQGREPASAALVVDDLSQADRLLSVDLHAGQIRSMFRGPFDQMIGMPVLLKWIRDNVPEGFVMVSPDAGRAKLLERYSQKLGSGLAVVHKVRPDGTANTVEALGLMNAELVTGRDCVVLDDMIDTAGTICEAVKLLKKCGARRIYVLATHGIFSGPAAKRLNKAPIEQIVVTDTINQKRHLKKMKSLQVVTMADLMARGVREIYEGGSLSNIFDGEN